jgi:putative SOS response-associated peptidase YedK
VHEDSQAEFVGLFAQPRQKRSRERFNASIRAAASSELRAPFREQMTCWPVDKRVGNVKNNDPSLIAPIAA